MQVISPGIHLTSPNAAVERESGLMLFVGRLEPEKGPLDALEAAFRPLVKAIPHDVEPALIFRAAAEDLPEEPS